MQELLDGWWELSQTGSVHVLYIKSVLAVLSFIDVENGYVHRMDDARAVKWLNPFSIFPDV